MFTAPFAHHPRKLDLIRNFTPNWFTVTMGTGVFALLLAPLPGLRRVGEALWGGNAALFGVFVVLYAARWVMFPAEAVRIFRHPVMPMFLGAIPMALTTVVNGLVLYAHDYSLALPLWELTAALALAVALGVPFAMFTLQSHELEGMTAVWLLPVVACEVAAASAGLLAPHVDAATSLNLVVAGYALWAVSQPLALGILVILFLRLALHKLPPAEMGVSSWLAVGPLGMGTLCLVLLGHAAPPLFGPAAMGLGLIGGLGLWAFAGWWLLMAAAMTLTHIPRGLPFNLGWWAFTFPFGVFILATNALAATTGLGFFAVLGHGLTAIFAVLWTMVAARTLAGAYKGHLFFSPCLKMPAR